MSMSDTEIRRAEAIAALAAVYADMPESDELRLTLLLTIKGLSEIYTARYSEEYKATQWYPADAVAS